MKEKEYGYIKLYRSLNNNEVLANDNNAFVVFVRLLTLVNRHSGTYTTGRKKLAVYMNMNDRTLYGVLKRLERATMLQLTSNKYATTIHICKWHDWQQDDNRTSTEPQTVRNTKQEREREEELDTRVSTDKALVKAKTPSKDIDEAFMAWQEIMGYAIENNVKYNRYAASNLLKKYTLPVMKQHIMAAKLANHDRYSRVSISDFTQLQAKMNDLKQWASTAGKKQDLTKIPKGVKL